LIKITERLIITNSLFLIDFKWSVLGTQILITIADCNIICDCNKRPPRSKNLECTGLFKKVNGWSEQFLKDWSKESLLEILKKC
jgi:hypothetical protein